MTTPGDFPLALIAGPTASGKSALAVALAERTGGVVVNADASQVYADLRVLTARPAPGDEARVPHRLFGHVDGARAHSAAEWASEAISVLEETWAEGRLPILVGGTGLYIRTLLDGIAPVPAIDLAIRAAVRALPVTDAHAMLAREDPAAAARIGPRDTTRTARALEVVRSTGRTLAAWQGERQGGIGERVTLRPLILDPPADMLHARCDARVAAMVESGALAEVAALMARGLDAQLPVMRAIGVAPLLAHLAGRESLDAAIAATRRQTRQYAKRQRTWNRHQFPADWPRVPHSDNMDYEG